MIAHVLDQERPHRATQLPEESQLLMEDYAGSPNRAEFEPSMGFEPYLRLAPRSRRSEGDGGMIRRRRSSSYPSSASRCSGSSPRPSSASSTTRRRGVTPATASSSLISTVRDRHLRLADLAFLPAAEASHDPLGLAPAPAPVRVQLQESTALQGLVPQVLEDRHQLLPRRATAEHRFGPAAAAVADARRVANLADETVTGSRDGSPVVRFGSELIGSCPDMADQPSEYQRSEDFSRSVRPGSPMGPVRGPVR